MLSYAELAIRAGSRFFVQISHVTSLRVLYVRRTKTEESAFGSVQCHGVHAEVSKGERSERW